MISVTTENPQGLYHSAGTNKIKLFTKSAGTNNIKLLRLQTHPIILQGKYKTGFSGRYTRISLVNDKVLYIFTSIWVLCNPNAG